jgi:hypothetical protein
MASLLARFGFARPSGRESQQRRGFRKSSLYRSRKAARQSKHDPASPELALVDALFPWTKPDSGRGFLGRWKWCSRCSARGYAARANGVWQACPDCYAGRLLVSDNEADQPI